MARPDPGPARHPNDRDHARHPRSPVDYPSNHHGWLKLIDDLSLDDRQPHDPGHIPLRWRLLVHYRNTGARWADVGRLLGITPQAAFAAYHRWRHHCCGDDDDRDT